MAFDSVSGAWRAYEQELKAYLLSRLEDVHAADDVLQDIFLKAMRQGAAFSQIENHRAWLFRVARNALIDRSRLTKNHIQLDENELAAVEFIREPLDLLDACITRNIEELRPEDREIIEQCDLQGMKQSAFATSHGLSLSAAKSRLLRARQRLRELLVHNCQIRFDEAGHVCCHVPRN